MITATQNKGFQLTFENKLTISVQFGKGNYCSNKFDESEHNKRCRSYESVTAEIAIWDANNKDFYFEGNEAKGGNLCKGWLNSDEVAKWIAKVQKAKDLKSLRK